MHSNSLTDAMNRDSACVHASCVAISGRGLLIVGPSGSGKSALALRMMALGAGLVADDRVDLNLSGDRVMASAPAQIDGLIEARGIGLLRAIPAGPVSVATVLDLGHAPAARLPDPITIRVLRQSLPLFHGAEVPNLAAAMIQVLKMGCVGPEWPNT